jgi:hypothetical protein
LHSQKKLLATLPAIFVTEQAFKAIFKIIGYKTTTFSWSLSLPRDAWDNFDSCLLVCLHQLKKLARALASRSTKRAEVNSHAIFVFQQLLRQQFHVAFEAISHQKLECKKRSIDMQSAFEYHDGVVGVDNECIHHLPQGLLMIYLWENQGEKP